MGVADPEDMPHIKLKKASLCNFLNGKKTKWRAKYTMMWNIVNISQ